VYIRQKSADDLLPLLRERLEAAGYTVRDDVLRQAIPLIQPRLHSLNDVVEKAGFLFAGTVTPTVEDLIQDGMDAAGTRAALEAAYNALAELPAFDAGTIEQALRALTGTLALKPRQLFGVLRVAVTAQAVAPPLFETMAILGRETTLARIAAAQALLVDAPVEG